MFDDLIDDATRRVCAACTTVTKLDGVATRAAAQIENQTLAGTVTRIGDTFAKLESLSVSDLKSATASLAQAGDKLVGNTLTDIESTRTERSLSATQAALSSIGVKVPGIVQNAAAVMKTAEQGSQIGQSLAQALPDAKAALARVKQSFGGATPISQQIEQTTKTRTSPSAVPTSMSANAHLLILVTMDMLAESFYFNLSTAGYDKLKRQTSYNVARQDRLTRLPALQAVAKGEDIITVSGAIFTKKSGAGQMTRLREIGFRMVPIMLTTGYGEAFGQFYISRIDEEQDGLFHDGMPRRQSFTLEFQRYGEDYQNV